MPKSLLAILPLTVLLGAMTTAGLAQTPTAADPDPPANTSKPGFFDRLVGVGAKKTEPKAADKNKTASDKKQGELNLTDLAAKIEKQESELFLARQAVCDKLRLIAQQPGHEKLWSLADQLEQRAWEIYLQRTGSLASGGPDITADEKVLLNHLGHSANPVQGPGGSQSSGGSSSNGPLAARKDGQ